MYIYIHIYIYMNICTLDLSRECVVSHIYPSHTIHTNES